MDAARRNPMYRYLLVLTISSIVGLQSWRILFNNFAVEIAHLQGHQIGLIQAVREVPGIIVLLIVFVLLVLTEHRLSSISVFIVGIGLAATGWFPSFLGLLLTTLTMSLGFHFFQVTGQSLTLQYFDKDTSPWVIGKIRSLAAASNVAIALLIYAATPILNFSQIYLLIGGFIMAAGIWGHFKDPSDKTVVPQLKKIFFRKKYWLYYLLRFLAGTRRQTFVAFALFLLVQKFHVNVQTVTILFMATNILNFFVSPYIGKAIIRLGERKVMSAESLCMVCVFSSFATLHSKYILIPLYVLGAILFYNVPPIATRTYFQKVGDPQDIAGTMAAGTTINHISTTMAPAIGGFLWIIDYRIAFIFGAILSVISFFVTQQIRVGIRKENL